MNLSIGRAGLQAANISSAEPGVARAIKALEDALDAQGQAINALAQRLSPVLRPQSPEPLPDEKKGPEPVTAPLAHRIAECASRVISDTNTVNGLLAYLEI